jgi:alanine racemase
MNKPHTWIEINKQAFTNNCAQYKEIIGEHNIFAPVIKANAYGHGMYQIADLCEENKHVDWLCVALLSDAISLRTHGITKPIFVLGYLDTDAEQAINQNIDMLLYDYATAHTLNALGKKHNTIFNVHIKIDTGLSRLGIAPAELIPFIKKVRKLPFVTINGVYSHLAESQAVDDWYSTMQITQFNQALAQLKRSNIHIPYIHIANSAATLRFNVEPCNLFRVGAGIYGIWPSEYIKNSAQERYPDFNLQTVLTWKTRIINLKKVPADTFVGYIRTHQTKRPTQLATIPIGYHDGYNLRYSNCAYVRIGNQYAPVVGRVCMNHTILDVTDIAHINIGDEVVLVGDDPRVNVYTFGQLIGNNNPREVLVNIQPHVPRLVV